MALSIHGRVWQWKKMNEFYGNEQVFTCIDYRYCPHLVLIMLKIKKRFKRRIKLMLISIIISSFLIALFVVSHVLKKDIYSLTIACRVCIWAYKICIVCCSNILYLYWVCDAWSSKNRKDIVKSPSEHIALVNFSL